MRRGEIPPSRIRSLSTYIINLCISSPNGQKEDLASFAKCRYRSFYAFRKARARERKRRAFRSVGRNKSARMTITTSAQRVPCKRNDSIHPKPSSTPSSYHPSARAWKCLRARRTIKIYPRFHYLNWKVEVARTTLSYNILLSLPFSFFLLLCIRTDRTRDS